MPYRKEDFFNGQIYHIVLRGLDDRLLFRDRDDYYRGIFSIFEFNNSTPVSIKERRKERKREKKDEVARRRASGNFSGFIDKRDKLVDIIIFCFMPNHIHLLLKQIKGDGIYKFMVKFGSGYGRYSNQKYQRKGYVFQNRFKSVLIKNNDQLMTVINYIHVNPVSLIEPGFKENGIRNHSVEEVVDFLKKYKWSSFLDYIGIKNFPSATERNFILEIMGGEEGVLSNITDWLLYKKEIGEFDGLFLE